VSAKPEKLKNNKLKMTMNQWQKSLLSQSRTRCHSTNTTTTTANYYCCCYCSAATTVQQQLLL